MKLTDMKIGVRLGAGFGVVLLLMAVLVGTGLFRLDKIGALSEAIIEKDWAKADAIATIRSTTRSNAALVLELFIHEDPARANAIHGEIDANKATITDALVVLDRLIVLPEGKELLATLKQQRKAYVVSFSQADKLLVAGQRAEAAVHVRDDTLPALNQLQKTVNRLNEIQRGVVVHGGQQIKQNISAANVLMASLGTAALLLGVLFAWRVTRSITTPIAYALRVAQAVAAGDLSSKIVAEGKDEAGQLLQALRDMNANLATLVGQVRGGTGTIAVASSQIASGNADLSARTEAQASALEETASSMIELTGTVRSNSDNARQADSLARSASAIAQRGGSAMAEVIGTMDAINASSRKIVDIIAVIDGIAFQTNILALNAAVEAARAGEQGRGFAVVASEVRNLAQRSAAAAKEIKELIADSVSRVGQGAQLVSQAGATMDEVVASVGRVSAIVGEISVANHEQSEGIEQINAAIMQMDQTTQQNAALVEEAAAAAAAMHEQAGELETLVSQFKLEQNTAAKAPPRPDAPAVPRLH
ncbi:methyl-accepting chemotaxis protein [Janthinobacterium lividum]|uniref:methyl-accepting chemotaxis protein n=1 Tax=Janthinobacterium lividum TaxID=29581 RepID=UPI0015951588|nr:methyl-accepting chemotaxis protein [Janthinobacterium lividum]QKY08479.1 HAMP domain-containing protein [Janthinobacterium lividum]